MKQQGHIELERSVDSIRVGSRHRVDLGDIDTLAESIARQGMLQPITVTPDGVLVCGARRLAALRQLGIRTVNVWVRAGVSDRLTHLLAEQDENALHKPLSPTEAAALYRECKTLLAEDAARRQRSSRFGANAEPPDSSGAVESTAPSKRNDRDARAQAALLVTGRRSFTRLERIARLHDIAADESLPDLVREKAQAELEAVDAGAPVDPAFRRISGIRVLVELDDVANSSGTPTDSRTAAAEVATMIRAGQQRAWGEDPKAFAIKAMSEVEGNNRGGAMRSSAELKRFTFTWDDLACWWEQYNASVLASGLSDDEWQRFEETLAGTAKFAATIRDLRRAGSAGARYAS